MTEHLVLPTSSRSVVGLKVGRLFCFSLLFIRFLHAVGRKFFQKTFNGVL